MDAFFQSSCSSCPSWLLELSSVVNARSGEGVCQLYRVLRGGRRTRCPSYMGRTNVGLSRPAGRGVLLVRRTSCPSPLEVEFDTASRSRLGGPAVAYGCTFSAWHRFPIRSTTKVTGRTKLAAICVPRSTRSTRRARRYQRTKRWMSSFSLRALRVLRGCSN